MTSAEPLIQTPTYPDLAGRVALITGGSRGIGAATCRAFAANKTRIAVNGRNPSTVSAVVRGVQEAGGIAIAATADCTQLEQVERMRLDIEHELGPVDILAAFAGGFDSYSPVQLISEQEWRRVLDSNLTATFLTVRGFLPGMIERRKGAILTMASNTARVLDILTTASYAAAKGGVITFTRHLAKEVGQYGIRANCLAPATVLSERVQRIMSDERREQVALMAPLGRMGLPDDVANAALFLASDASSWITGVTLDVAGGRVML
jgi:3-oxoacyl-[acyl-carrier protein] reductase